MAGPLFPSGPWVGFYTYENSTRRFLMDLHLHFQKGIIRGEGADGLDSFAIEGVYDVKKKECSWKKIYPTRPSVDYQGYRDGKGIWGRWLLSGYRGGFHIWPLSEGGPPDLLKLEEEDRVEKTAPVAPALIPVPAGGD